LQQYAQSVAISDDGSVADGSAILDVKSTTKGVLTTTYDFSAKDAVLESSSRLTDMVY
jgi:hypothetical protein